MGNASQTQSPIDDRFFFLFCSLYLFLVCRCFFSYGQSLAEGYSSTENTSSSLQRCVVIKEESQIFGGHNGANSGVARQGSEFGDTSCVGSVGYCSMENTSSSLRRPVITKDEPELFGGYNGGVAKQGFEFGDTSYIGSAKKDVERELKDTPFVYEKGFYQPSKDETWEAYQALITLVEAQSKSRLSRMVLCGVADEVLSVLKSNALTSPSDKKAEIEKILMPIRDFVYDQLVIVGELITDYYLAGQTSETDDPVVMFVHEEDFYQPKSNETSTAYKLLLDVLNDQLPWQQSQCVRCVLAHEVLVILKDMSLQYWQKKSALESSLDSVSYETFDWLLFIADLITDFSNNTENGGTEVNAEAATNDYHCQPNLIPRQLFPGIQYESAGQIGQRTSLGGLTDGTKNETVSPIAGFEQNSGIKPKYDREEEPVKPMDDEVALLGNTNFIYEYSSDEEPDKPKLNIDASPTVIGHVYNRDDKLVKPRADETGSIASTEGEYRSDDESGKASSEGNKRISGSICKLVSPAADVILSTGTKYHCGSNEAANTNDDADTPTPGTKLEYSSEDDIIYFDHDKSHDPISEDEDGWVMLKFDEDGI